MADVYLTDELGKHKLCIANPWANKMKGDANSAYPNCHYNYAIVHVPTLHQEMAQIAGGVDPQSLPLVLQLEPTTSENLALSFSLGFGSFLSLLLVAYAAGIIVKGIATGGRRFF